jgi:hypothetical protein
MLGYVLSREEVLAYYGGERKDVPKAIFNYGHNRRTLMVLESGGLGRNRGDGIGFKSPGEIFRIAEKGFKETTDKVPRKYPAFHATIGKFSGKDKVIGVDMVFDIDVKSDYSEAFKQGARIVEFLDSFSVPYRLKFSGGSGPHIIIPSEVFPPDLPKTLFGKLFSLIITRSKALHVDSSFNSPGHYLRVPYSLNENTGLVSLPLTREQFEEFEPAMAEVQNVRVDESWFEVPDDAQERMERFIVDLLGKEAMR